MSSDAPAERVRVIGALWRFEQGEMIEQHCLDHLTERHHEPAPVESSMIWMKAAGLEANA